MGQVHKAWWESPLPVMDLSWMNQALCREVGADMFFPEKEDRYMWAQARRVCNNCPVITQCLDYALAQPQIHGVFGGTTQRERALLARRRRKVNA